jgi:hypothetical protein
MPSPTSNLSSSSIKNTSQASGKDPKEIIKVIEPSPSKAAPDSRSTANNGTLGATRISQVHPPGAPLKSQASFMSPPLLQSTGPTLSSVTTGIDPTGVQEDSQQQQQLAPEDQGPQEVPVFYMDPRHTSSPLSLPTAWHKHIKDWRSRERLKTVSVALVLCLNIGVDPPDVTKTSPCSKLEAWIDPFSMPPQKALEAIGRNLQAQYEVSSLLWEDRRISSVDLQVVTKWRAIFW